jgi:hypothetical protein
VNAEVVVFPAKVDLLTNKPTTAENTARQGTAHGNRRLRLQFERAPDDGHDSARNMLTDVYVTKQ